MMQALRLPQATQAGLAGPSGEATPPPSAITTVNPRRRLPRLAAVTTTLAGPSCSGGQGIPEPTAPSAAPPAPPGAEAGASGAGPHVTTGRADPLQLKDVRRGGVGRKARVQGLPALALINMERPSGAPPSGEELAPLAVQLLALDLGWRVPLVIGRQGRRRLRQRQRGSTRAEGQRWRRLGTHYLGTARAKGRQLMCLRRIPMSLMSKSGIRTMVSDIPVHYGFPQAEALQCGAGWRTVSTQAGGAHGGRLQQKVFSIQYLFPWHMDIPVCMTHTENVTSLIQ